MPYCIFSKHFCLESELLLFLDLQKSLLVSFQGCWTQWQRFESSSSYHFWDTPLHFLKTCFSLESGFLVFIELQYSLLVSFQGCWTQWQSFERSSNHCFWDIPQHFLKTILLRKWLTFIPSAPEILTSKFSGGAEHNGKGLKALAPTISEILHSIFSKPILLRKWLTFILSAPEIPTSKFSRVLNTMPRIEISSTHHFWDTPQHFLKTHFCLRTCLLSFLELQKSLLVSFQGCWTQWQRFESSSIHCFWDTL